MGIDWHTAQALIAARSSGVDFTRTATLGRQNLYVSNEEINAMCARYGLPTIEQAATRPALEYADEFFHRLGTRDLLCIDASSYEGASEVHDMNLPIPDRMHNQFDLVVDGGTLEHVFNFPVSIKNVMQMVRVGGHLLIQSPTNNYCGHGFYQFSPELYYRVLSPDNGFLIERMLAYEAYPGSSWYAVPDPADLGARVEILGSVHRVAVLVQARRLEDRPIFDTLPVQSDYSTVWRDRSKLPSQVNVAYGIRKRASIPRRLIWRVLSYLGPAGRRSATERAMRFTNKQLQLSSQPDVFSVVNR